MTDLRHGDRVSTEFGVGTYQWLEDDGRYCVWILPRNWTGKEYPPKFDRQSPTIAVRVEKVEKL